MNILKYPLTPSQRSIYRIILRLFEDNATEAFPLRVTREFLAHKAGCSTRTISSALRRFEGYGWIETVRYNARGLLYMQPGVNHDDEIVIDDE